MEVKTIMRYYFIYTRMVITKKTVNNKDVEKLESSHPINGNVKWCSFFGK